VKTRALLATLALACAPASVLQAQKKPPVRFEISFPAAAHGQPVTGRVYVMITRSIAAAAGGRGAGGEREPRSQVSQVNGVPFFGKDVDKLAPGAAAVIDETTIGYPVETLREIPDGEYYVQALVNVYSEFKRADGHVVWMHDDQWEGQQWSRAPGNLVSKPQKIRVDASKGYRIQLVADQVLPPVTTPPDTKYVKRIKMQSPMLTKFWGRPIYMGATVLLPRDFEASGMSYPVHYVQGHFGLNAPMGFNETNEFSQHWLRDDFPRMIVVTWQHPTPYYDDSYAVNSPNNGPYGDALLQELMPEVEKRFRAIREPWARTLSGGSTGGWEALALQLFHPDLFGGTWASCPDPVSFHAYEGVDIYADTNAFYKQHEWYRVPTTNIRNTMGEPQITVEMKNHFESVAGTHGRSGHQLDIWEATFGPVGADGYYKPLIDQRTGTVDQNVVAYWKEHSDLLEYMKRNWATLGPKLVDKIHVAVGDMDTYQLDVGVVLMDKWMETTANPHYAGEFTYGDRKPHCWSGPLTSAERLREIAGHMLRHKPDGVTTPWWKY
jgi:hypothetical protein